MHISEVLSKLAIRYKICLAALTLAMVNFVLGLEDQVLIQKGLFTKGGVAVVAGIRTFVSLS